MPMPSPAPLSTSRLLAITLAALMAVLAWDGSGLDLPAAQVFGTPFGFPWRFSARLGFWLHEVPRILSWAFAAALIVGIRWPMFALKRIGIAGRLQLVATMLVCVLAVSLAKASNHTSCPYDLEQFGGVAEHVSHWAWRVRDGGPGGCFPAGHASAAFAYVGGYFVFRRAAPGVARGWLLVALALGAVLGVSQQLRGAHFMSHTLWTAWICWSMSFAIALGVQRARRAQRLGMVATSPIAAPSSGSPQASTVSVNQDSQAV